MCDDLRPDRGARDPNGDRPRGSRFKNHTEQCLRKYQMLIGGKRVDAVSGQWFESFNPYTGKPWALIPRATPEDVNRAVASARAAFKSKEWRGLTATARGKLLLKIADLIAARADALGRDRDHRQRQADPRDARADALSAGVVPLLRRASRTSSKAA